MYWKDDPKYFFFTYRPFARTRSHIWPDYWGGPGRPVPLLEGPVAPSVPTPLYRKGTLLNTNMFVVAFHMVLKYVYMKGKVNKRMEKCIFVLLKLTRDKGVERLIKLEKRKNTERINLIRKHHQSSLKLSDYKIIVIEEKSTWEVRTNDATHPYTIHYIKTSKQVSIQLLHLLPRL